MIYASILLSLIITLLCGQTPLQSNQPGIQTPSTTGDEQHIYTSSQVTRKAVITVEPIPGFTEEARHNGTEGKIRIKLLLKSNGQIGNVTPLNRLPDGLTEKAIDAAQQLRFIPAEKDGHPVSMWITLEYSFDLIYDEKDKVQQPIIIVNQPQPEYTEAAHLRKTEGKVVLDVAFFSDGRIEVFRTFKSLPYGLTEEAIKAASRIEFTPARDKGSAVSQMKTITYTFSLSDANATSNP